MIQSILQVGSAAELPNLSDPVSRVGSEGSRSESERSGAERSEAAGPEPTQPKWIQTNLATKLRDQTGGLVESWLA